ncbi:MAG: hypothetical protein WD960_14420 [Gemmatimonadota bacterium]
MSFSLVQRALAALVVLSFPLLAGCGGDGTRQGPIELEITEVADAGFETPAAVIHDPAADVYLVASVGGPFGADDANGFISRLSPDGEVLDLHWIRPTQPGRELNSPQGLAIRGDSLFIADLDCIRIHHRETGEDLGYTCLDGVTHITDVDVGPEGSIFVVDSGLDLSGPAPTPTGTDAVYRLVLAEGQRGSTLASSEDLGHPRGIAVGARGIFVSTSGSGEIFRLTPDGQRTDVFPESGRHLDGIAFLPDGGFAFSSWSDEAIYLVTGAGDVVRLFEGISQPGGIAYDPSRTRLVVPLSSDGRILFLDMPADPAAAVEGA